MCIRDSYALAGEAMRAAEEPDDHIPSVCDPDAIRQLASSDPSRLVELIAKNTAALPGCVSEQLLLDASGHDELLLLGGLLQGSLETEAPYAAGGQAVTAWYPAREPSAHGLLGATLASILNPDAVEVRVATIRSLWREESDAPSFLELRSRRVQLDLEYVGPA